MQKSRIHLLDEIRGAAIICMVFYHAFFTLAYIFDVGVFDSLYGFFTPVQPVFAALFIFISGMCARLTHSNLQRGAKLAAISLALTAVTYCADRFFGLEGVAIYFGILHLLAASMLLYAAFGKAAQKLPFPVGVIIFALLFALTYNAERGYLGFGALSIDLPDALYKNNALFALGFHNLAFYSGDYFPLLPWVFMFFIGSYFGKFAKEKKLPKFFYNSHIRPVAFCGRHSLVIYLAHQPIIYGLAWIVTEIIKKVG